MDTIVAIATTPGRSAIGVIRLSGPESLKILRGLIGDDLFAPEPNHVYLKQVVRESGEPLDSALVTYFEKPRSFTGEEMIELSCHGSPVILRRVLDLTQNFGARLAEPGEFTLRACKNGKMNLSQAEAIRDLINAQTDAAAAQAARQLKGELAVALQPAKEILIKIIVRLESALEFVEDDLPRIQSEQIEKDLAQVVVIVEGLARTYATGRTLREGLKVAIVGRPNVGKSSLFNRLVRMNRAIVTEIAGTTRDSISESISIGGIPISITDTAGIRVANDSIEEIGIERTHQVIADADLLVVVIDGSTSLSDEDLAIIAQTIRSRHVVAINKCDLVRNSEFENRLKLSSQVVHLSALTGEGLDGLIAAILAPFGEVDSEAVGLLITDCRHYDLLRRTQATLEKSVDLLSRSASEEIVLVGLHNALQFLGEITGETTTDYILGEIFSTFCIGK
ncbi:MAG TPA: tRNA uridine-5-carboxymethylaminomethyl(34) synthesis GTPase MnmE [Pyrinomonadaceae bacterium]|nr:tRNA uridine-5-carboxymethylaminomethyl(34) synthesis GTPase MnmE [Pyrinomonadaceae bacterium]